VHHFVVITATATACGGTRVAGSSSVILIGIRAVLL
jgi:hypothetical protein